MAKSLRDWVEADVRPLQSESLEWLSQTCFFRDPARAAYSDPSCFFSPADGVILYQKRVRPNESLVDIKGTMYSLRDALRDPAFDRDCLVIGIFMTFYDVHINRVPLAGRLSYRQVDPIDTYNHPMLDVERALLEDLRLDLDSAPYLHLNQRMVNRVESPDLDDTYYILQIADYDVDCITPFELRQNQPWSQGQRFSQIRYGSQVDLIVPLSDRYQFQTLQQTTSHVEAGVDPLIRIIPRNLASDLSLEETNVQLPAAAANGDRGLFGADRNGQSHPA